MKKASIETIKKVFEKKKVVPSAQMKAINSQMSSLRKKLKVKEVEPGSLITKARSNFKKGVQALV